jgi:hypothetical protein
MPIIPAQRRRVLINPNDVSFVIHDLEAFIGQFRADDEEPFYDAGGGMEIPLAELLDDEAGVERWERELRGE